MLEEQKNNKRQDLSADGQARQSVCLLVHGMQRSGTSATTRVLTVFNAAIPEHDLDVIKGSNDTAHWQPASPVNCREELPEEPGCRKF
jgi:hypothetical protein